MERAECFSNLSDYLKEKKNGIVLGELSPSTNLFDAGYLESLDLPGLLDHLEAMAGRELDLSGLSAESFFTMEAIFDTILAPSSRAQLDSDGDVRRALGEALGVNDLGPLESRTLSSLNHSTATLQFALERAAFRLAVATPPQPLPANTTVGELVAYFYSQRAASSKSPDIVPLCVPSRDPGPTLFLFHPVGGSVLCYCALAAALRDHVAVYGVQSPHLRSVNSAARTFEDLASHLAAQVVEAQPQGNIFLGGWSFGASLAAAVRGHLPPDMVRGPTFMLDPWVAPAEAVVPSRESLEQAFGSGGGSGREGQGLLGSDASFEAFAVNSVALTSYVPRRAVGPIVVLDATADADPQVKGLVRLASSHSWRRLVSVVQQECVGDTHDSVVRQPAVSRVAQVIAEHIARSTD
jgi:hypothetical protein